MRNRHWYMDFVQYETHYGVEFHRNKLQMSVERERALHAFQRLSLHNVSVYKLRWTGKYLERYFFFVATVHSAPNR